MKFKRLSLFFTVSQIERLDDRNIQLRNLKIGSFKFFVVPLASSAYLRESIAIFGFARLASFPQGLSTQCLMFQISFPLMF